MGLKMQEVGSALEVLQKAEGQGETGPRGHQDRQWHRVLTKRTNFIFSC